MPKKRRTTIRRTLFRAVRRTVSASRLGWWAARLRIGPRLAARLQKPRWNTMVEQRQLKGLRRGKVSRIPVGIQVGLALAAPLTFKDVAAKTRQIEAGLGLRHESARVRPSFRADRALLQIVLRDPLAKPVLWTPPTEPVLFGDPMLLSVTPFGDAVRVDLRNRIGVFGTSGSGKSCVQRLIGIHTALAVDAELEVWDLKFGTESQHYEGKAHRITRLDEAIARIDWYLHVELPRRAEVMKKAGTSTWKETPANPCRLLMVDEGNVLVRQLSAKQLGNFFQLAEQGRALGVYLVWATQFPKATNLPTELRSQLNVRICMKLLSSEESAVVFKDEAGAGWEPHKLTGPGWLLVKSDEHREPEESKAVWLDEGRFRAVRAADMVADSAAVSTPVAAAVDVPDSAVVADPVPAASVRTVRDDVWEALALSAEPAGVSELARRTGRSKSAVQAALVKLDAEGVATRFADGFVLTTVPDRGETPAKETG